jgi:hypothetical protein
MASYLTRLFFHRIQLLVCILVACGWYIVLTKKQSELDHLVFLGKRIDEGQLLLATTAGACVALVSCVSSPVEASHSPPLAHDTVTIIFLVFFILPTILFSFSTR